MTAAAPLDAAAQDILALAREAIRYGVELRRLLPVDATRWAGALAAPAACFVSLHLGQDLRGCIGQTESTRSLAENIVENAYGAAFRDPRFDALSRRELAGLSIEVHVLGPLEPLAFADLAALHALLRPGRDGLQLELLERRGVFLPVMWNELPTPDQFVANLLRKAGIRDTAGLRASRFSARVIS
jgi:AmmeMemoRadiSam system protein A